jgi:hypothetical protein
MLFSVSAGYIAKYEMNRSVLLDVLQSEAGYRELRLVLASCRENILDGVILQQDREAGEAGIISMEVRKRACRLK